MEQDTQDNPWRQYWSSEVDRSHQMVTPLTPLLMVTMNSQTIIFPFSATSILSPKSSSNYHLSNTTNAPFTANYIVRIYSHMRLELITEIHLKLQSLVRWHVVQVTGTNFSDTTADSIFKADDDNRQQVLLKWYILPKIHAVTSQEPVILWTLTLSPTQALVTSREQCHLFTTPFAFHSHPFQSVHLSVHCFLPPSLQPTYVSHILLCNQLT
jgi:hypothetical protein